ncbi:hypothetical protein K0U07_01470 [bacterium]|nr:hypothetical protein [bacterium]
MKDEFQKIIDLFSLESEEKEKKLEEIFRLSMNFIEKYKYIQHEGTDREKEDISKKLAILKEKISIETKSSETELGLSKQEIEELSADKSNFSEEQWKLLQQTKKNIQEEKETLHKQKKEAIKENLSSTKKTKNKSRRGRSKWLKS